MTVENLEIQVKTKGVSKAAKDLVSMAEGIERVEQAGGSVNGSVGSKTATAIKEVGKAAEKSNKGLGNFLASLKRIAFYRVIRGIIKSITQAFTEGLEKAYLFSAGISDVMGHRFAQAMDNMKSATNAMKGQLGSAFISLLAALEPILIRIIDFVTRVADAISQFFAAFTGTTYLKANKTAAQFADTMARGGASAKEWRNQLMGFDEINRLNEPSQGGGGGGTNPLAGYDMQDTPLDKWAMKIHDNLEKIELAAGGLFLALGLILTLTGANIPLGLGLIVLGAHKIAKGIAENWETGNKVINALGGVERAAWLMTFGIGLIFALTGNLPIGLGLMGISLVGYATTINWGALLAKLKETWGNITKWYQANVAEYLTAEYWQAKWDAISIDFHSFADDVASIITSFFQPLADLCAWIDSALQGFGLLNEVNSPTYNVWEDPTMWTSNFASGGFPSEGQLFVANEAGPELVGTMGGRTAVANSDSIVEGIRQGVYEAVSAANNNGGGDVQVRVYLDSREIKAGQQRLNRAWGV